MLAVGEPRRILIIDDNVDLAENIAEILRLEGHVTDVAASGEEALAKYLEREHDVVVTDYRLPGMSGAEFLRQFRRRWMNVRTVVISAYTDESTIGEAKNVGASFFAKPVDFTRLASLVREGTG